MRTTCLAHLILLDWITLIISGEAYNHEALHYAVSPSLSGAGIAQRYSAGRRAG
jgi:hypothetical protein